MNRNNRNQKTIIEIELNPKEYKSLHPYSPLLGLSSLRLLFDHFVNPSFSLVQRFGNFFD